MSEPQVFHRLAQILPSGTTIFAGNSMPVRDLDSFFPATSRELRFMANRGASGIDGVVSTALGAAAAGIGRLVLIIGDLSLYHDMNGLLAAKRHNLDATIVLINNDGGGIFSFLPQNEKSEAFEELFGTPHGLNFRHTAVLYGLEYALTGTSTEFDDAVIRSLKTPGVSLIEVRTDRDQNLHLHREIWAGAGAAARTALS
jgi:2-succinyl-5-enolpyruvyl-6-hydroxy-3-cyclohexene-1-carboxylate synthase